MKTDNNKDFNIYDIRISLDRNKWIVDGENGYNSYSKTLTLDQVRELYKKGH